VINGIKLTELRGSFGQRGKAMKTISLWLAAVACITGLIAAFYWWRSAMIDQSFNPNPPTGNVVTTPSIIPGYLQEIYSQLFRFSDTSKDISRLNRNAALLTAISVGLSGLSSWFGS
jgi:hypothetical protein